MKLLKIIKIIIIIFVAVFLCLEAFILTQGKALLSDNLKKILGENVEIGSLYIIPPYSISINNFKIEDLLTAEKIEVQPSIIGLFLGKIGLNKLIVTRPTVSIVRIGNTEFNLNPVIDNIKKNQNKESPHLGFIKQLLIKSARLSLEDKTTGFSFDIMPMELAVNTSLPDFKTRFNLDAQAVSQGGQNIGKAKLDGWLNFLKKDMDAKFSLDDLGLVYFSPYFKGFFKKIQSGKLNFDADMISKSNDLVINCHLETRGLTFVEEPATAQAEDNKIAALSGLAGFILNNIVAGSTFDFSIHTKFDNPKPEGIQFKGNIFEQPIKNIIENPKDAIEQFKKAGEDFKKIGKDLKEQFKDIGDIFKGKAKKTEESTQQ